MESAFISRYISPLLKRYTSFGQRYIAASFLCLIPLGTCANTQPPELATSIPPLVITHKLPELNSKERILHEVEILKLALDKTTKEYGPYELRGIPPMNRARTLVMLSHDNYPNLVLQMSYEDELAEQEKLIYIPFPLDRGALSYRICFMRDELKEQTKNLTRIHQLKPYDFGVGIGWSDAKVLRHNNLAVVESSSVVNLFRMTKAGRIDFFCRGPLEYYFEAQHQSSLGLSSDAYMALYYPLPKFFFAHKNSQAALNRIQKGLDIAFKDGSFDDLWRKRHIQPLQQAKLKERNIIKMENPSIKHLARDYETYLYDPVNQ